MSLASQSVKKILFALTLPVVLLASVLLINTVRFTSKQIQVEPIQPVSVDESERCLSPGPSCSFSDSLI